MIFVSTCLLVIMLSSIFRMFSNFGSKSHSLPNKSIKLVKNGKHGSPYSITEEQKQFITNGDPEISHQFEKLLMILLLKHERGDALPKSITVNEMFGLLSLNQDEVEERLQLYLKRENRIRPKPMTDTPQGTYDGAQRNSIFLPILETSQSSFNNINLEKGRLFGQNVVLDCSYDSYMNVAQLRETAKYLNSCVHINGKNRRPFGLNFCNVERNSKMMHYFKLENGAMEFLPINVYQCSYLDLFYKEDVVYVTPHANQKLEYHPDDVYVIGALSGIEEKLSLKKARFEGIRCAKLPLSFRQMKRHKYIPTVWEMFQQLLMEKNINKISMPEVPYKKHRYF
ncbi:Mitochondrial ribonuclease P protein 1-like protein [Frankliniella fusca]|uniref:Mitochondrial ribonuclease P protein 1-like protein n=1 Tax=Frankliniella fusca TaxID=407009 RepID=A0AAE1L7K1_9NEOP|nr:Mitochondrial ribonuclease P protein 1-like protein [Frankliniella fusca]